MVAGNFSTQHTSQPFRQTPMDQTLEQSLNKNSKTKGGMIGFSINKSAVHRWIKSFADRAEIQSVCEHMAGRGNQMRQRTEMDISRRIQDEESVKNVVSTIEAMTNLVSIEDDELVNIVSGAIASPEVKEDIARAKSVGEAQCSDILITVNNCLMNRAPESIKKLISLRKSKYDLRSDNVLSIPKVNTTKKGLKSWRYFAPRQWNHLDNSIRSQAGTTDFVRTIRNETFEHSI